MCPVSCDAVILEQEVFAPTGADHLAVKLIFFNYVHQDFRLFRIINVNKDGVISQNPTEPIQVLHFIIGFPCGSVFQFFNACLALGFNITFVKHLLSPTLCDVF